MFQPRYQITNEIIANLLKIERSSSIVEQLPLPTTILEDLKKEAQETTVLLSTKMEGNRLSDEKKREALYQKKQTDEEQEIYNLMKAIEFLEESEQRQLAVTEEWIKKLHAVILVTHGRRPRLSEYRMYQNKVGDRNQSGFYLPPEYTDVPVLMEDLIAWINAPEQHKISAPIKAGIVMWQFLTIHPYMDGNGRTARMVATYILRRSGYGLKGLFVLENFYDRNLNEYYKMLQLGLSHNYYFGRNDADITLWLEYFLNGLADVYSEAASVVQEKNKELLKVEPDLIRQLDIQQRLLFRQLVFKQDSITITEICKLLNFGERTAREKVKRWIEEGLVQPKDSSAKRIRTIILGANYEHLAKSIRDEPEHYKYLLSGE